MYKQNEIGGGINMKRHAENRENITRRKCGTVTCIHCICNVCTAEKCDFYERTYRQEH